MACDKCDGSGCADCNFIGNLTLTRCPQEMITSDIWQAIEFAELFKGKLPPIDGGVLDQANIFVEASKFIWAEQNFWKRKLKILE